MEFNKYEIKLQLSKTFDQQFEYKVNYPEDIFKIASKVLDMDWMAEEHMYILNIDTKGHVIGIYEASKGTINQQLIDPREIFKTAILQNATAVIAIHNHPSGDSTPGQNDIDATKRLAKAGEILGIPLLDHIIVSQGEYKSMATLGYMK